MTDIYLLVFGVFIWYLSTGLREGYTFTKFRDRLPLLDYHSWRYVEQLGILIMVYAAAVIDTSALNVLMLYVGLNWVMVYTVYEPALDYMITGKIMFFKQKNSYTICNITLNMGRAFQVALTAAGGILVYASGM